jgi:DNA-binding protein HU-beta
MAIGKQELVESLAKRMDSSKAEAQRFLDAFTEEISQALEKKNEVNLTGFGKFTVAKQAGREGVNPQTGAKMKIQPKVLPKFKAGAKLKERVG